MDVTPQLLDFTYAVSAEPGSGRNGIIFCARGSGLFRSIDGGLHWENAYEKTGWGKNQVTLSVAHSPGFGADRTVFAGLPGAVVRSTDAGITWKIFPLPAPPPLVTSLLISPGYGEDGVLFAGTVEDGVFRSADRGEHWAAWNFGLLDLSILCMAVSSDFLQDETLFVGAESGIFQSTNGGRAWREVNFPTHLAPVVCLALSPHYPDDLTMFAGTEENGLFISRDDGNSWTLLGEANWNAPVNGLFVSAHFPDQPDILTLVGSSLFVTRDGGAGWQPWKSDLEGKIQPTCLAVPLGISPESPLLVGIETGAQWV